MFIVGINVCFVPEADIEVLCIAQSMVAQRSYQASRSSESSRKAYSYDEARPPAHGGTAVST
jgi:hypothetical protein